MNQSRSPLNIYIEGNIGAGKSTLIEYARRCYGGSMQVFSEPLSKWRNFYGTNYLQKAYAEPEKYLHQMESLAQLTVTQMLTEEPYTKFRLIERSLCSQIEVFSKLAVAQGCLDVDEFKLLNAWYKFLIKKFDMLRPALFIYLRSSPNVAHCRMMSRGRPEESMLSLEYLTNLHEFHEMWLNDPVVFHEASSSIPQAPTLISHTELSVVKPTQLSQMFNGEVKVLILNGDADFPTMLSQFKQIMALITGESMSLDHELVLPVVSFARRNACAMIPQRATPGSIGYDLYSSTDKIIPTNGREAVKTDLTVQLPYGCYGRIAPRSGLTLHHGLLVGGGVIDPDFTGELMVILFNLSPNDYEDLLRDQKICGENLLMSTTTTIAVNKQALFHGSAEQAFQGTIQRWDYEPASNYNDLIEVLTDFSPTLEEKLSNLLRTQYKSLRFQCVLTAQYTKNEAGNNEPICLYLRSSYYIIWHRNDIAESLRLLNHELVGRNDNAIRQHSSITISKINTITIFVSRFEPLVGRCHQKLPAFLQKKRAIINVQNRDERCFGYALLSALYPKNQHACRAKQYRPLFARTGLDKLEYPIAPNQISEIEEKLQLRINVFSFFDDEGKGRYPVYISSKSQTRREIDLLYWNEHYAWIKSFSAFIYDLSGTHDKKSFCKRCFGVFLTRNSFQRHLEVCTQTEVDAVIYTFPPEGTMLGFRNIRHQLAAPFVIYADFEALLRPKEKERGRKWRRTKMCQEHIPSAAGVYIVSKYETLFSNRYATYTGHDVIEWFLKYVCNTVNELMKILERSEPMVMSLADIHSFDSAIECSVCGKPFEDTELLGKVRDHDHLTGRYRGAAHRFCNIQLQQTPKICVFFHNFRGYDSHMITLFLDRFPEHNVSLIAQGYEKYLTIGLGRNIVFKDSYQFMSYSLDALAAELRRSGVERFVHMRKQFPQLSEERLQLLFQKGIFPYEYMDSWERLEERSLPPMEMFDSKLRHSRCTQEEYTFAQSIWKEFNCETLKDYQDLYLKTDVLLLADVFENFRAFSLKHYRLDPAHYVSAPQLSWDAMLLYTDVKVELMHDPEMFKMIDAGIRGGVAMITHRYAKANNPEMGNEYRTEEALSYIVYLDANNLYGWAMSQQLPVSEYAWLRYDEWKDIKWSELVEDLEFGFILECDLAYPKTIHDEHSDYPLAPEKKLLGWEKYNETQLRILSHYSIPKSSLKVQKLIPHLLPRRNYVIHYRVLAWYLKHGLQLTKVHRVIRFRQSKFLAPYIVKNQNLRALAKSDFEKNQPKLFNNSIYGKTCENQKRRSNIRLTRDAKQCKRLIEKPQMRGFRIFTEQLAAVNLRRTDAKINKPFVVGFAVLELSKLLMYEFHYDYIKSKFGEKAQLLFTDTDSLMYHIHDCNPYEQFFQDRHEYFDFASFPKEHKYYDASNNKIIGKFSDEACGKTIKEFVGLRPKMYSYTFAGETMLEKHRAKGIQYQVAKNLKHADFLAQLNDPKENRLPNRRIGAKLHRLYTFEVNKRGLCSFDDKRVLLEDGISTLPYGHYAVTADEWPIGDPATTTYFGTMRPTSSRCTTLTTAALSQEEEEEDEEDYYDDECEFD